jgi:hypothetical protein
MARAGVVSALTAAKAVSGWEVSGWGVSEPAVLEKPVAQAQALEVPLHCRRRRRPKG